MGAKEMLGIASAVITAAVGIIKIIKESGK